MDISFLDEYISQLVVVEDTDDLRISYIEKDSEFVVLSFSSTPPDNTRPHEQFITTLTNKSVTGIYVVDKKSSYGNGIDWIRIQNAVTAIANGRKIVSVGYCMGATLAVISTRYLPIPYVLGITPQYSIHPSILPKESFLNRWSDGIEEWKIPSLDGYINEKTDYVLLGTKNYDDVFQAGMFPQMDNIRHITFDTTSHDLPRLIGSDLGEIMIDLISSDTIKNKFLNLIVKDTQ